jgi:epoxide hydrolase-like predicted phosphatase
MILIPFTGKLFKEVRIIINMKKRSVSEKSIKAIIFDVGGVLQLGGKVRKSPKEVHISGVHEIIANKLRITLDQYMDSIDSAYAKSIEGQISRNILVGILSLNLNIPKEKIIKLYHSAYKRKFKKNKALYNIARQLKKQGYKIAILSDQWHLSKDVLIPKKDQKLFDEVIISCDMGMRKPNIDIYELVLKKLNINPEESIFIDNQEWNLIPAHKMGIKTILFIDNKKTKEQLAHFGIEVK